MFYFRNLKFCLNFIYFYFDKRISSKEFENVASSIKMLFPTENQNLYYKRSSQGSHPSGKLYNAYNNFRQDFGNIGLVNKQKYIKKVSNVAIESVDVNKMNEIIQSKSEAAKDKFWKESLIARRMEVKNSYSLYMKKFAFFYQNDYYVS